MVSLSHKLQESLHEVDGDSVASESMFVCTPLCACNSCKLKQLKFRAHGDTLDINDFQVTNYHMLS